MKRNTQFIRSSLLWVGSLCVVAACGPTGLSPKMKKELAASRSGADRKPAGIWEKLGLPGKRNDKSSGQNLPKVTVAKEVPIAPQTILFPGTEKERQKFDERDRERYTQDYQDRLDAHNARVSRKTGMKVPQVLIGNRNPNAPHIGKPGSESSGGPTVEKGEE